MDLRASIALAAALAALGCTTETSTAPEGGGFGVAEEEWTFLPIDGAVCGNGSPTGFGVNPTSKSKRLLVHLEGGGACYSKPGCTGKEPTTAHFDGYGEAELAEWAPDRGQTGNFDRGDAKNPLRDFSMAFVPYCTGDVHAGNRVDGELHYVGQANLKLYLARLREMFPDVEQVVLSGESAGGFGTMYNFWLLADAFAGVETMWIDDSGPLLPMKVLASLNIVIPTWGLEATIAPGCDKCFDSGDPDGGPHQLIPYYAMAYPGSRGALLSSLRDKTIIERFLVPADDFEAALNDLADTTAPKNPDFRVYYLEGDHHVWLDGDETTHKLGDVKSGGVSLATFIAQELDGDAGWKSVRP